jgi:ribosomal protein S18 acetylase RimI-like enzyme
MQIALYEIKNRAACLRLFRSNMPTYFAASDEMPFAQFLDELAVPFWVIKNRGKVCACGGIAINHPEPKIATLCWGIVASTAHRRGIGSAMLDFRIRTIATEHPSITRVRINTTQLVQAFYERHAFVAVHVDLDGYGSGLNRVVMDRVLR